MSSTRNVLPVVQMDVIPIVDAFLFRLLGLRRSASGASIVCQGSGRFRMELGQLAQVRHEGKGVLEPERNQFFGGLKGCPKRYI